MHCVGNKILVIATACSNSILMLVVAEKWSILSYKINKCHIFTLLKWSFSVHSLLATWYCKSFLFCFSKITSNPSESNYTFSAVDKYIASYCFPENICCLVQLNASINYSTYVCKACIVGTVNWILWFIFTWQQYFSFFFLITINTLECSSLYYSELYSIC